jgi:hypothetical protein
MKNRTLNELRQVKEYGWKPKPTEDLVKKLDDAIKNEINSKQDQVAQKLDMILDLEDIIMTEMKKVGLGYSEYPEHEFEVNEAFTELFEYALKDLRYHYFNNIVV